MHDAYRKEENYMTFIKKMCILRQVKQGFSGDGKSLSGLIKAEQYGKNIAIEVSVINFAPLSSGEYYCLLADCKNKTELLPLRGKSLFNIVSDLDLSGGFCGVICFVKNDVVPIAYGVNGNKTYNFKELVRTISPSIEEEGLDERLAFSDKSNEIEETVKADDLKKDEITTQEIEESETTVPVRKDDYDDETVASENYYQREENTDERVEFTKSDDHVRVESDDQAKSEQERTCGKEDGDAQNVCHAFTTESDGYYRSVRSEIDELFKNNPTDDSLKEAFPFSEWVKITQNGKAYLVGVIYEELKAKYICYAIPAESGALPPEEIRDVCAFVPLTCFPQSDGFFVIFQSAATGECIRQQSV